VLLSFLANNVHAAKLEDVKILEANFSQNCVTLRLHSNLGAKDSYFFVDITKSDPSSFEKMGMVIKKLERGEEYKLDLEIISFSVAPSGSYYRSESVKFLDY
jgi:hypothetical protein